MNAEQYEPFGRGEPQPAGPPLTATEVSHRRHHMFDELKEAMENEYSRVIKDVTKAVIKHLEGKNKNVNSQ